MKEKKFPHTRKPLYWRRRGQGVMGGEASEPRRRAQQQGCGGQSGEIPAQRIGADQHAPAREACLLIRRGRQGLGAEARALEVRPQGEDWGWQRERSLKGASVPQLAGKESGEKVWNCLRGKRPLFWGSKERGFRVPPKQAPEVGASCGCQCGHQRRA